MPARDNRLHPQQRVERRGDWQAEHSVEVKGCHKGEDSQDITFPQDLTR